MFLNRQGSGNSPVKFPYFKSSGHFCDFPLLFKPMGEDILFLKPSRQISEY